MGALRELPTTHHKNKFERSEMARRQEQISNQIMGDLARSVTVSIGPKLVFLKENINMVDEVPEWIAKDDIAFMPDFLAICRKGVDAGFPHLQGQIRKSVACNHQGLLTEIMLYAQQQANPNSQVFERKDKTKTKDDMMAVFRALRESPAHAFGFYNEGKGKMSMIDRCYFWLVKNDPALVKEFESLCRTAKKDWQPMVRADEGTDRRYTANQQNVFYFWSAMVIKKILLDYHKQDEQATTLMIARIASSANMSKDKIRDMFAPFGENMIMSPSQHTMPWCLTPQRVKLACGLITMAYGTSPNFVRVLTADLNDAALDGCCRAWQAGKEQLDGDILNIHKDKIVHAINYLFTNKRMIYIANFLEGSFLGVNILPKHGGASNNTFNQRPGGDGRGGAAEASSNPFAGMGKTTGTSTFGATSGAKPKGLFSR